MHSKKHYSFDSTSGRDSARPTYTSNMYAGPKESNVERENYQTKEDSRQVSENITKSVMTRSVIDKRSSSTYRTRQNSQSFKTRDLEGIASRDPSSFALNSCYDIEEKENKAPLSSFYSSYSKDEDLSDVSKSDQPAHNMQNGISSLYLSGVGAGSDGRNVDQKTKNDQENKDSARTSGYKVSSGLHATQGESWKVGDKTDASGSLRRERSLERNVNIKEPGKDSVWGNDDPRKITLEDTSILRRALERKQASNSMERERLTKTLSGDHSIDPLDPTSRAYLSFSSKHNEKDSPEGTADQYPKTRSSVTSDYDLDYRRNTRTGSVHLSDRPKTFEDAVERLGHPSRSTDSLEFPGGIRTRSRSSGSLDKERRSKLGIYQELPGRKEFLSYSRSLSNAATSRSDGNERFLRDDRRTGSLDRYSSRIDYNRERDRDRRASLLRLRSRSSEELRSVDKNKENEMYPRDRSSYRSRQGSTERVDRFGRDVTSRRDFGRRETSPSSRDKLREEIAKLKAEAEIRRVTKKGDIKLYSFSREPSYSRDTTREMGPSSHEKLREDIARLKAKTETRESKRGDIKLYSFSREPSIQDKLKEDIAKLKVETLTRDHVRPHIPPPPPTRNESENVSSRWKKREPSIQDKLEESIAKLKAETRNLPSQPRSASGVTTEMIIPGREMEDTGRWKSWEPSIQDKLKESIAKLKAETRNFPSQPRGASSFTTEMIIPGREMEDTGRVRQSGLARTSIERYHISNRDGNVFKDELKREETQRFGKDEDRKDYTAHKHDTLRMDDKQRNITDEGLLETSREFYRPTRDQDGSFPRRPSEGATPTYFSRARPGDSSSSPRADERRLKERNDSLTFPAESMWDEPKGTSWQSRTESTQGYASKKVYRADSTVSISSTKDSEGGPSSATGFFHGSVSKEDHSAYFSKQKGDKEDGYPEPTRVSDPVRRDETTPGHLRRPFEVIPEHVSQPDETLRKPLSQPDETMPEPVRRPDRPIPSELTRRPDEAIPLPYTGYEIISPRQEDSISPPKGSRDEPKQTEKEDREVHSEKVHSTRESVTRKTVRDSVISRESSKDDVSRLPSKVDTPRRFSERFEPPPRRTSIREEIVVSEEKIPYAREVIAPIPEYKDSKPSGMSELMKKIEQLKSKVDSLDDSRARMRLEKYVDEHSETKSDVEIKDPVKIKRYQPSQRRSESASVVDGADPHLKRQSIDITSESISRQISRQISQADTIRRISSIHENDLRVAHQTPAVGEYPDELLPKESKPDEKPAVMKPMCDAETMTTPEVQELVGTDRIRRQDPAIRGVVEEPERLEELRGVPIDHIERTPQIKEVGKGQVIDSGVTTIQIDDQQQSVSPKKHTQGWWNASTAEDVDRLLELGHRRPYPWNAYTAEDVDKMFQLGPVRRRSLRRGSYERRSFRKYSRRPADDLVDVHVRVRARQEKRIRPQCIIAQAAPEEKAIVLRDVKESSDPFISKIKVDDVYGADAVRVENGVVKIKVGDMSSKGRKTWARILQQQNRIIESDGTVTIPIGQDHYEDGVYQTNYYQRKEQDGTMRLPMKFKRQEQDKAKANRLRVVREIKRAGSMRRKRRGRGYIVGARYYSGNLMLKSADGYHSYENQREIVLRQPQQSSKVTTGSEIVLRSSSQPTAFPMQTVQRIHEGHRTTRQAASCRDKDGKMVITVHAVPPQPPRFNLKQVGENMTRASDMLTTGAYHGNIPDHRGVSSSSGNYYVSSTSGGGGGRREYVTTSASGRQGSQGNSYFVTDPSDSFDRRVGKSGYHGVTRAYNSNEVTSTPTIIPYEDGVHPSRRGTYDDSFIADPSSFYGFYDAPGSRIVVSDPRLNARTGYGEKFNLRDHGDVSSVQYVNGARQGRRIINEKVIPNGRYRYGSSWNTKQQEKLNGRSMAWAVEDVRPDF